MIETVPVTGSTNADLSARIRAGEYVPEGTWLIADRQDAGRGRQGRVWQDGLGNFMGSCVVWPGKDDPPPGTLALMTGLAVAETLSERVPPPHRVQLKWPNDLLINGAKLSGILLESSGQAVVVGIGVNLAQAPVVAGRETIALSAFGPAPDRDAFARRLAQQFALELARWREFGLGAMLRRWQDLAHPPGTLLSVGEPGEETLDGTFAGLASDGALQLRLADGTTRTIHAGEVRLGQGT